MFDGLLAEMARRGFVEVRKINITIALAYSQVYDMDWVSYLIIHRN